MAKLSPYTTVLPDLFRARRIHSFCNNGNLKPMITKKLGRLVNACRKICRCSIQLLSIGQLTLSKLTSLEIAFFRNFQHNHNESSFSKQWAIFVADRSQVTSSPCFCIYFIFMTCLEASEAKCQHSGNGCNPFLKNELFERELLYKITPTFEPLWD